MTISKLATEVWPLAKTPDGYNRFYERPGRPQGFIVHHAAMTSDSSLKYQYVSPARELSSNYAMRQNGDIAAILHEEYRPFTSSSPKADNWGITIEIANLTGAPDWKISDRAFDQLARLIADCATRWDFPIDRGHVIGHREVLPLFGQGKVTACPGPWLFPRLGDLCALARKHQAEATKPKPQAPVEDAEPIYEEDDMIVIRNTETGHVYTAGQQFLRHETSGAAAEYVADVLTRSRGYVQANAENFDRLLNSLGIPAEAATAVLRGKVWSPSTGVLDARAARVVAS